MKKITKKLLDTLLDKLMGSMIDTVEQQHKRDPFEKENTEDAGAMGAFLLLNAIFLAAPGPIRLFGILWPLTGLTILYFKLGREARAYNSDRWTEFLLGWKLWTNVVAGIYFWPLETLFLIFSDAKSYSFRQKVESLHIQDMFAKCGRKDHAWHTAQTIFKGDVECAENQSQAIHEMPEHLVLSAKRTSVCGATAMTLATSAASAATSVTPAPTTNSSVTVSSSGWVAAVEDSPLCGKPTTTLRYARLQTSLNDTTLHVGVFNEMDLEQLQFADPDWVKQAYLTYTPTTDVSFRAGRLFIAPGWTVPAPHSVQTVNYPRGPYSTDAYALQADVKAGQWHYLADVSGRSDLTFSDHGQFQRVEGSMRIERDLGPHCTVAWTGQASSSFTRTSFDILAKPTTWLDVRGMFYYGTDTGKSGLFTKTAGAYAYAGTRPLDWLPQLELHGQTDIQQKWGMHEAQPVILTEGLRLQTAGGKYSATADYQHSLGTHGASDSDGFFLRFQRRF